MTYTYAILDVSPKAYREIKEKLEEAGYEDQFHEDGGRIVLDMHGIALAAKHDPGCPAIADDESDLVLDDCGECTCGGDE